MPASPWRTCHPSDPSREYLVLLSFLPLKRRRRIPSLLTWAFAIVRQLRGSSGLIAYSLYTELTAARFWTLSVWESESALQAFVHASPHMEAMGALVPHMGPTRFVRWTVKGADLPISWQEALRW